ncbi:transcriptional regulator family: Fungal Specific TF [Penicillium taxi]|uniref:transcriptional regulator family: Fungal Specific TF n=1 Tax=Penicillium taxi TaxID=168475 RepID=UPI002545414C|nr:transcriptional regulator family: Fungal Specific TF [Penicillium taxi]KAJ5907907.1 transcriptional regulator family: Fungal Specific TF [Penicillium taxi]
MSYVSFAGQYRPSHASSCDGRAERGYELQLLSQKKGAFCYEHPRSASLVLTEPIRSNAIACDRAVKPAKSSRHHVYTVSCCPKCGPIKPPSDPFSQDAVPKKRGPKSEMLEALLKRVDGLEKRLKDEKNPGSPTPDATVDLLPSNHRPARRNTINTSSFHLYSSKDSIPAQSTPISQSGEPFHSPTGFTSAYNLQQPSPSQNGALSVGLLDTYFARIHGKPFFIVDETTTRQQYQSNQLPTHLSLAISAMTTR